MKTICTILFCSILSVFSCKTIKSTIEQEKNSTEENQTTSSSIIGRWKLIKTSGGFAGKTQAQPADKVEILEFTPTEMIRIYNGKETFRTTYTLGKGKSIHKT